MALTFSLFLVFNIRLNNHLELNFRNQTNCLSTYFNIISWVIEKAFDLSTLRFWRRQKYCTSRGLRLTLCRSRLENLVSKKLMRSNFRCKKEKDANVSSVKSISGSRRFSPDRNHRRKYQANKPSPSTLLLRCLTNQVLCRTMF